MKKLIAELYSKDELAYMNDHLAAAIAMAQTKGVSIDMTTRQERRKMGTARQGYVNLIRPVANNNLNSLPRDKDAQHLNDLMDTFVTLSNVRGLAQKMMEWTDDTMMALGIDTVSYADSIVQSLQTARRDNDGLDIEMGEIDAYNSRFGRQMEEEDVEKEPVVVAPTTTTTTTGTPSGTTI